MMPRMMNKSCSGCGSTMKKSTIILSEQEAFEYTGSRFKKFFCEKCDTDVHGWLRENKGCRDEYARIRKIVADVQSQLHKSGACWLVCQQILNRVDEPYIKLKEDKT